jgi:hypothetical protein
MREIINSKVSSIESKGSQLKEKAERSFGAITVTTASAVNVRNANSKKTPPISYILYGIAGVSALGFLSVESGFSKLLCAGLAAASAYGGYNISNATTRQSSCHQTADFNIMSVKNGVSTKVIEAVKQITREWEEFMTAEQRDLQRQIHQLNLDAAKEDSILSKISVYEVIDISLSDFNSMVNRVNDSVTLKQQVEAFKVKLIRAIDNAVNKQIAKYRSICE